MSADQPGHATAHPPSAYVWGLWITWAIALVYTVVHVAIVLLGEPWFPMSRDSYSGPSGIPFVVAIDVSCQVLGLWACIDYSRGKGYCLRIDKVIGGIFLFSALFTIALNLARYGFRMSLYPQARWAGIAIGYPFNPAFIGFYIIFGAHQFLYGPPHPLQGQGAFTPRRPIHYFAYGLGGALLVALFLWSAAVTAQYPYAR